MKRITFLTLILVLLGILTSCLVSDAESISTKDSDSLDEKPSVLFLRGSSLQSINDFRTYISTGSKKTSNYEHSVLPGGAEHLHPLSFIEPYYTPLEKIFPISEEILQTVKEVYYQPLCYDTPLKPIVGTMFEYCFDGFAVIVTRSPETISSMYSFKELEIHNNERYRVPRETITYKTWCTQNYEEFLKRQPYRGSGIYPQNVVRQTDKAVAQYESLNGAINSFEVMIQGYRIVIGFRYSYEDFLSSPSSEPFRPFFSEDDAVFEEALNALVERLS